MVAILLLGLFITVIQRNLLDFGTAFKLFAPNCTLSEGIYCMEDVFSYNTTYVYFKAKSPQHQRQQQ